jgi:hypothetical protein
VGVSLGCQLRVLKRRVGNLFGFVRDVPRGFCDHHQQIEQVKRLESVFVFRRCDDSRLARRARITLTPGSP